MDATDARYLRRARFRPPERDIDHVVSGLMKDSDAELLSSNKHGLHKGAASRQSPPIQQGIAGLPKSQRARNKDLPHLFLQRNIGPNSNGYNNRLWNSCKPLYGLLSPTSSLSHGRKSHPDSGKNLGKIISILRSGFRSACVHVRAVSRAVFRILLGVYDGLLSTSLRLQHFSCTREFS
jgi:hypothetical protein